MGGRLKLSFQLACDMRIGLPCHPWIISDFHPQTPCSRSALSGTSFMASHG
jgi:hypothetical protein